MYVPFIEKKVDFMDELSEDAELDLKEQLKEKDEVKWVETKGGDEV